MGPTEFLNFNPGKGLLLLFFVFGACGGDDLNPRDFEPYNGPISVIHNLDMTYSDSAIIKLSMKAPVQEEFLNRDRVFPEGVSIIFFDDTGGIETTLDAFYGKVEGKTNLYLVRGNVIIKNLVEKRTLYTEELYWDPKKERIYTEKNVIIDQGGRRLTGRGLEARQDFSSYEIEDLQGNMALEGYEE